MIRTKFFVKQLARCCRNYATPSKLLNPELCPPANQRFVVAVMEAGVNPSVEPIALLLKQNPMVEELRLYDDKRDICGTVYDLSDIDTRCKVKGYVGEEFLQECLKGVHVVVTLGGGSSYPYENYEDLFHKNADEVRRIAIYLTEFNHDAVFVIGKPPAESLIPMVYEEYQKADVKSPESKIIGVANYVSMRTNVFIAKLMKVNPFKVTCPIAGGVHCPETIVPLVSHSLPGYKINDHKVIGRIQEASSYGEQNLLKMKVSEDGGTLNFTPSVGAYRVINNVLKGLRGDQDAVDCAFLRQTGDTKKFLKYMTCICVFGRYGVASTHITPLNGGEIHRFRHAYPLLKKYIHMGEHYVTGKPFPVSEKSPPCATCPLLNLKKIGDDEAPLEQEIIDIAQFFRCDRSMVKKPTNEKPDFNDTLEYKKRRSVPKEVKKEYELPIHKHIRPKRHPMCDRPVCEYEEYAKNVKLENMLKCFEKKK